VSWLTRARGNPDNCNMDRTNRRFVPHTVRKCLFVRREGQMQQCVYPGGTRKYKMFIAHLPPNKKKKRDFIYETFC